MIKDLIALAGRVFGGKKARAASPPRPARLGVEPLEGRLAPSAAAGLALPLSPAAVRGFNPQPEPPGRPAAALDTSVVKGALVGPNSKAIDQVFAGASQNGPSIFAAVEPTDRGKAAGPTDPGQARGALVDFFRAGS